VQVRMPGGELQQRRPPSRLLAATSGARTCMAPPLLALTGRSPHPLTRSSRTVRARRPHWTRACTRLLLFSSHASRRSKESDPNFTQLRIRVPRRNLLRGLPRCQLPLFAFLALSHAFYHRRSLASSCRDFFTAITHIQGDLGRVARHIRRLGSPCASFPTRATPCASCRPGAWSPSNLITRLTPTGS
jgi:hypothetical protein